MFDWSDEAIERLKALLAEGYSYSGIAREMGGGLTRNAAIGKAKRLGLEGNAPAGGGAVRTGGGVRTVSATPRVKPMPRFNPAADEPAPVLGEGGALITLRTIGGRSCRWFIGDGSGPDAQLCANPTPEGKSFCEHHAARLRSRPSDAVPTVEERALSHA